MSETVKNLVLGLCAVSLLSGLCTAAVGDGRMKGAVRLVSAFAAAAVIIAALRGGGNGIFPRLRGALSSASFSEPREAAEVRERAEKLCCTRIEDYIQTLGESMGLACRCESEVSYEGGVFYLDLCRVSFPEGTDENVKRELIFRAAQGLGTDEGNITEG